MSPMSSPRTIIGAHITEHSLRLMTDMLLWKRPSLSASLMIWGSREVMTSRMILSLSSCSGSSTGWRSRPRATRTA